MTSQNIWNMCLLEHFFNGLGLYSEQKTSVWHWYCSGSDSGSESESTILALHLSSPCLSSQVQFRPLLQLASFHHKTNHGPRPAPLFLMRWTWTGEFKCREVKTGFYRIRSMQTGSSGTLIGWKSGQTTFVPLWDWMEGAWPRTLLSWIRISLLKSQNLLLIYKVNLFFCLLAFIRLLK